MVIKTEGVSSPYKELNRISMSEMLKEYHKWLDKNYPYESQRKEKVNQTEFAIRVRKNGYETNTGYINKEMTNAKGKTQLVHIGPRVQYVANVKWLPGANIIKDINGTI